jgi:hypothetical protein
LHHKVVSSYEPDFYAARVVKWRWIIYPWALTEDLVSFIGPMTPRPDSLEGLAYRLREEHGLRVPREALEDALVALGAAPTSARKADKAAPEPV